MTCAVRAGGTVEIPFTATIPGGFEVELEKSGKTLFQLRVAWSSPTASGAAPTCRSR